MKHFLSLFLFSVGYISSSNGWSLQPLLAKNIPSSSLSYQLQQQQQQRTSSTLYSSNINDFHDLNDESNNNNDDDNDDAFMASLRTRLTQSQKRSTILPLIVLDTMLPRQVLKLQVYNPTFLDLIRLRVADETPTFGMIGIAKLSSGQQVHLKYGVEVQMEDKPVVVRKEEEGEDGKEGLQIQLVAKRRFCIEDGSVENNPLGGGWTEATVEFLDSGEQEAKEENENIAPFSSSSAASAALQSESTAGDTATTAPTNTDRLSLARAISKARQFTTPNIALPDNANLIDAWISLARQNERRENQIDTLLSQLGEIPPVDCPSERAFWVGALINPIPALGVALEVRPALLTAKTAEDRVNIALDGLWKSIRHMDGSERLW